MPMTMINRNDNNFEDEEIKEDRFFNDDGNLLSKQHLLTERNQVEETGEQIE